MKVKNFSWKIGGEAGYGIMSTGLIFSKIFSKKGYFVVDGNEYPSLVRGGHNTYSVRVSTSKIDSIVKDIDMLVALNEETVNIHLDEMTYGGYLIHDENDKGLERLKDKRKDLKYLPFPFDKILEEIGAPSIVKNNIALGASVALINYDLDILLETIKENFKSKGKKIVDINQEAARAGYNHFKKNTKTLAFELEIVQPKAKILVSGNDAVFLGAVRSGCKFYCAYPMTPASSILHSFAACENDYNIIVKHAESEIAVVNMAMGASFAGVRSMIATSGGGFSLMNEGLSATAMTETPLVIVLAQRPAPATGLPTWSEQGDMLFAVNSAHGEFLRVVIAPGDALECFHLTGKAFNLAEKYQIPVIILLDKYLSESHFAIEGLDPKAINIERGKLISNKKNVGKNPKRYELMQDGISPRPLLGLEGFEYIANTDEHDEKGFSDESAQNRKNMMDKRFAKINELIKEIPPPQTYGPEDASVTILSWGSCKGPILEALKILNQKNQKANLIHFNYLYPFNLEAFNKLMQRPSRKVVVENNKTSQLSKIIMLNTGIKIKNKILKYSGRQFLPNEIIHGVEETLNE